MKISLIYESPTPDLRQAVIKLTHRLYKYGFKLVSHCWEEASGNNYLGYFVSKYPKYLSTYKLGGEDLNKSDSYLLAREWLEEIDWGGHRLDPEYDELYKQLQKICEEDEDADLQAEGGLLVLPDRREIRDLLSKYDVAISNDDDGWITVDQVVIDDEKSHTHIIKPEDLIVECDDQDLLVIAERLYNILGGEAKRWEEYRKDTKSRISFWAKYKDEIRDMLNDLDQDDI